MTFFKYLTSVKNNAFRHGKIKEKDIFTHSFVCDARSFSVIEESANDNENSEKKFIVF